MKVFLLNEVYAYNDSRITVLDVYTNLDDAKAEALRLSISTFDKGIKYFVSEWETK